MSSNLPNPRLILEKTTPRSDVLVYVALTASAFCWGAGFAAGRIALRKLSAVDLLAGQALLAAAFEVAWMVARRGWSELRLPARLVWPVLALGLAGQNILNGLTFLGLTLTSATNAALIYGFSPVLIGVFAALFLSEPFSRRRLWGALVGFAGVAIIITQGRVESVRLSGVMAGNLLVLGGAVYWAAYAIVTRSLARRIAPHVYTFYVLTLAAVLPLGWVSIGERRFPLAGVELATLLAVAFLGVGTGVVAMNFWNWGLSRVEASRVGVFSYLEPVFAGVVAITFLGERLTLATAVGAALVFAGIFLTAQGPE